MSGEHDMEHLEIPKDQMSREQVEDAFHSGEQAFVLVNT